MFRRWSAPMTRAADSLSRTALLQKKSERIARVEIDARELRQAAAAENEFCMRGDLLAALDERKRQRRGQLLRRHDHVAYVPDPRAIANAQPSVRGAHRPRFIDAIELDHEMFESALRGDAGQQQAAEHQRQADVERVVAGVDGRESDDDREDDERRADPGEADHAVELPFLFRHGHVNVGRVHGIPRLQLPTLLA